MKFFRPLLAAFLLLSPFTLTSQTKQNITHVHGLSPVEQIDGSKNPEKIPDLEAYRLYFLVASTSANPTKEESAKHWAHINKVGLNFDDAKIVSDRLSEFRSQYDQLIKRFNEDAERTNKPDYALLIMQRDALVQSTIDKIKGSVRAESSKLLDDQIQREKKGIRIARPMPQ